MYENLTPKKTKMRKLQQFFVLSFNEERLRNNKYNINLTIQEAEKNEELIALADNECLRAIRRITNHPYSEDKLQSLFEERKFLIKQSSDENNKKKIAYINKQIKDMLYIPEFISVTLPKKTHHRKLCEHKFIINGIKYKRLMCGAAQARTNRCMFVAENIYDDLDKILRCGIGEIEIIPAKWNAYYALSSSASHRVRTPRVLIVPDYKTIVRDVVDWVVPQPIEDDVQTMEKDLKYNIWDGMGLISPDMAELWAEDLGVDYLPSGFIVRSLYIKGLLVPFDFHKFSKEVAEKHIVKDLYGNEIDVDEVDVILTQSQFKLWFAYKSFEEYEKKLAESGCSWGVARIAPYEEKSYMTTNYQFLQVLDMKQEDIEELCKPTIDFLKGVSKVDPKFMQLYLLGKRANDPNPSNIWLQNQDCFLKCLFLYPEICNDRYINDKITKSIQKRMKEAMAGSVLVNGSFQLAACDPYALCEYVFGLEINGLLKKDEHYSGFWNRRQVETGISMRSPMTWVIEVNEVHYKNTQEMAEWFKYIRNGIIFNIYGIDRDIHSSEDFDGDLNALTDNKVFLRCRQPGPPVLYEPEAAKKQLLTKDVIDNLHKVDVYGFDTKVGYYTNIGTYYYALLALFEKGTPEYDEILKRIKLICKQQNLTIDAVKGLELTPLPEFWTKRQKIEPQDDEETIKSKEFNNKLVVPNDQRPYFMRYVYPRYNTRYKEFLSDFDDYSMYVFGYKFKDCPQEIKDTPEYLRLKDYYEKKNPLLDTPSVMNNLCHYLEENLKPIKRVNKDCDNAKLFELYFNQLLPLDEKSKEQMVELKKKYDDFKHNKKLANSPYSTYEQFYKAIRNEALEKISSNMQELSNMAVWICYKENPSKPKDFLWDCFGQGIVYTLTEKKVLDGIEKVQIPTKDIFGDVDYLGDKFSWVDVPIIDADVAIDEILEDNQNIEDIFSDAEDVFSDLE